jgi:hypothetical protein
MRKSLLVPLAASLLLSGSAISGPTRAVYGQENSQPRRCADVPGLTSATHVFRREGESIEIPIRGDSVPASVDCEPVALSLHWNNGRNNGSSFTVTFLDDNKKPIQVKYIFGFMTGVVEFPLSPFDARPVGSSVWLISVPTTVTIQAVPIFAAPANLSYTVIRVARVPKPSERVEGGNGVSQEREKDGNEIVSIHDATRLIGGSRLPLIQIELRTSRPFPVRDVPLQLRIGNKNFLDELSGDYTGRKLTLSLTPEMFADLKDGEEIKAFFGKANGNGSVDGDVWLFGKLNKATKSQQ